MSDGLIISIVAAIVALGWAIRTYNRFIQYRNLIEAAWSGIDIALKQRFNLIPNLVRTVKGYGSYESGTLEAITDQRTGSSAVQARIAEEDRISASLNDLLAVAEAYPDLKANTTFLELQRNLTETEQQVLTARQRYNDAVRRFNTLVESFPANQIARFFDFRTTEYFEVSLATQRALPEIDL